MVYVFMVKIWAHFIPNTLNWKTKASTFYEGNEVDEAEEAKAWIDAVVNDTEPVVKPEQAMVVTKILEAIYQSAKSGKAIYFE